MNNHPETFLKAYRIAEVTFTIESDFLFEYENLGLFEAEATEIADIRITAFHTDSADDSEAFGTLVLSSPYMNVRIDGDKYRFYYNLSPEIYYCEYDSDTHSAQIVIRNTPLPGIGYMDFTFNDHFFFAVRDVFFFFCQQQGMITLHSSSIIYNGRAYLFSAPSGTGKSTHTALWEQYCGVKPLNGDVALLSVKEGTVYAHGMPWCGTSEKYSNQTVPLGKIIFLKRADSNAISVMNSFEAILNICSRSFSPNWTKALSEKTLNVAKEIDHLSPCLQLKCLPEKSAMELVKNFIDKEKSR